jgi:hypothetical protein
MIRLCMPTKSLADGAKNPWRLLLQLDSGNSRA